MFHVVLDSGKVCVQTIRSLGASRQTSVRWHSGSNLTAALQLFPEKKRNDLLEQYPELADELEEEIKRMELENAEKQAELDDLQTQGLNEGGSGASEPEGGAAFVPRGGDNGGAQQTVTMPSTGSAEGISSENSAILDQQDMGGETADIDDGLLSSEDGVATSASDETTSTQVESPDNNSTSSKEDFELSHLAIESLRAFVKHAKDDVKRILDLVVPVMQPLLTVGDTAWRQIKALFVKARDVYCEASQNCESADQESTEESENEDAAIA